MQTFTVTARERDTVLAALRYYQFYRIQGRPFDPRHDHRIDAIAAEAGAPLDLTEIDDLCAVLNDNADALAASA